MASRMGGVKTMDGPRLPGGRPGLLKGLLSRSRELLVKQFQTMLSTSHHHLAYLNKFVPHCHIPMPHLLPAHLRGGAVKVQIPTKCWSKLGSASQELTTEPLQIAFMGSWQGVVAAYPRMFYESFVCENLDSLCALCVSLVSFVQMRLVLLELLGKDNAKVQHIFESISLVPSEGGLAEDRRMGHQIAIYARRSLTCDTFFHMPFLAQYGSFHELSKFKDMDDASLADIVAGKLQPTLSQVLDAQHPVLDWLGSAVARVAKEVPVDFPPKDLALVTWTVSVLAATHRPKSEVEWCKWTEAVKTCSDGADFQSRVLDQPSSHSKASGHGGDYCSTSLTTQALMRQINEDHSGVLEVLAKMFSADPPQTSLADAGFFDVIRRAKHVKQPFRMSHICGCLIVAMGVVTGRMQAGVGAQDSDTLVGLKDFSHAFRFKDGPNLKLYRLTHNDMEIRLGGVADEGDDDDDDDDDAPQSRPLKIRRSDVHDLGEIGPSLSRWMCDRLKALYGPRITFSYKVGGRRVQKSTSFHLSEICLSSTICQAQKFQELRFLIPEAKNLRL